MSRAPSVEDELREALVGVAFAELVKARSGPCTTGEVRAMRERMVRAVAPIVRRIVRRRRRVRG